MTEAEFTQHFRGAPVVGEDDPGAERINSPQRLSPGETSGYSGEVLEAVDLPYALELSRRGDLRLKGGIRFRYDEETVVHAYFWEATLLERVLLC